MIFVHFAYVIGCNANNKILQKFAKVFFAKFARFLVNESILSVDIDFSIF